MSEVNGTPWGMCAAFGCPLFATRGSEGRWYCFCHVDKPSTFNDAITSVLKGAERDVVELTLAIRRDSLHGKPDETGAALRALKSHPKFAELRFNSKQTGGVRAWLQSLERHLLESVADIGVQKRIPTTVPTAPVIGPTHALSHYTEVQP